MWKEVELSSEVKNQKKGVKGNKAKINIVKETLYFRYEFMQLRIGVIKVILL